MIRDPSDGSVKEINLPANEINRLVDKKPSEGITGAPIDHPVSSLAVKAAIMAGKVKPERISTEWIYQRAWNDALDFVLTQIGRIEKQQ